MIKRILCVSFLLGGLTACATPQNNDADMPRLGMANPASVFCVKQGGKLVTKNEANGQVAYCHLANGQVIEEWKLFRASQAECVPEEAKRLIGQSNLTGAQILEKTKAKQLRSVQPNQPVTMDYRSDRVTVVTDPKSKKIVQASCG
ncbi:putative hemolysin [Acinetobacter sp. KS-LM10]|uniref:putative hemolysin n=1 Tax=Acinetobacter sp. KS-LM10 TaxID=3120518 RepID=UPI00403F79AE